MALMHSATTGARTSADPDPVLRDFLEAFRLRRIWLRLAWMDIRLRYRRSYLGPWWLTIHGAAFILAVGTIFGLVLGGGRANYLPYFCIGYILWGFISHALNESCEVFVRNQQYILHMRLPYPMWIWQLLAGNLLTLLHMVPIYIGVALVYRVELGVSLLALPLGCIAVLVNVAWMCVILSLACLRYRDLTRLTQTVVHIAFLATPILWQAERLGDHVYIALLNPIFHMLEVVRAPLLGEWPLPLSWAVLSGMAAVGWSVALVAYGQARHRVAFWL